MRDPRLQQLARNIVGYSLDVQAGEKVLIEMVGSEREIVKCLVEEVHARGGYPYIELADNSIRAAVLRSATKEQMEHWANMDLQRMKEMDCYVAIRSGENVSELSDVPDGKMKLYNQIYRKKKFIWSRGSSGRDGWCCAIRTLPWLNWPV